MIQKRRNLLEALENRQLLAANCAPLEFPVAEPGLTSALIAEGEQTNANGTAASGAVAEQNDIAVVSPGIWNPGFPTDYVQEVGNRLYVVDPDPNTLHIFERTASGEWQSERQIELDVFVQDMIVRDKQVILLSRFDNLVYIAAEDAAIAPPHTPSTTVTTINLRDEVEVISQRSEGAYDSLDVDGDRLVMRLGGYGYDYLPAIYPPPEILGTLNAFEITEDGLREFGSVEVPQFGHIEIRGDHAYVTHTKHPDILPPTIDANGNTTAGDANNAAGDVNDDGTVDPEGPTTTITRYVISPNGINAIADLQLPDGFVSRFEVSDDGSTAVAIRQEYLGIGNNTFVDLISLAANEVELFESIQVGRPNQSWVSEISIGPGEVVLSDYEANQLLIVTTDQSIDLAAENRVTRVDVPENWSVLYQSLQVTRDRLVISAIHDRPRTHSGDPNANGTAEGESTVGPDWHQERVHGFLTLFAEPRGHHCHHSVAE